ncbi:class I SAM-dependent DNA methyltransferase [Pediococcus claussenii]|uniref:Methyltransferase domain protein n=1 Tax=Pediococcus claussenii (strain ATCC BAA-344 / DSM 14800 / JCM 18046 / KCTC 3811 / LMG 21948 / P06) TaxID=701521 RepID=G8PDQ1_PEDCP|nr:class I SAM-dependent methyltransferase [Pediococcus claussenii]AEV95386.1 methyltransferase domain protein [Pediococcus claussenii ATCC BAA-344]ANZ68917.1 SAM-dependent methyltransferase [Pediococcus claussenii]ANZ70733.1 SAM-dependent methyltransferase [Pediococcus claussenii]KRN19029.1 hypothetical protein IV79_GL001691 [Pediococcus claussenii]
MIYQTFAGLYDQLFDSDMYQKWFEYTKKSVKTSNNQWLELACGAGRLAVLLAKDGQWVTGFDLSDEMLALANQHAEEADVDLELIQGNMLDLNGLEDYDVISCYADSFCYLQSIQEVKLAFRQVYEHLKKDGTFIFDVITPYQTNQVYPGYMYNYQDDDRAFMWESFEGDTANSVEHELTFFIKNDSNDFKRVSEIHIEQTYELQNYLSVLQDVGFANVEVSSDFGKSEVKKDSTRWFFKCRRS